MEQRLTFGSVNLGTQTAPAEPQSGSDPFRILLIGDFSGRGSRHISQPQTLATRRPIPIDRDNFEDVLTDLNVELHLALPGAEDPSPLTFQELDEFRPEALFDALEHFAKLRQLRRQLLNPKTFAEAAKKLSAASEPAPPQQPQSQPEPQPQEFSTEGLLDAALEETEIQIPASNVDRFIAEVVAPS